MSSSVIPSFTDVVLPRIPSRENKREENRTPNQIWLNVGVSRQGPSGPVFLSLPLGIPCDGLEPLRIPGPETKNQEFRMMRVAQAKLLKELQEAMARLKPGERVLLPLQVELYRRTEAEGVDEIDVSDNPFLAEKFL